MSLYMFKGFAYFNDRARGVWAHSTRDARPGYVWKELRARFDIIEWRGGESVAEYVDCLEFLT